MDPSDEHSQLLAALEESLCRDPDIEFAVAFGSRITGGATPSSDFDFAVKFADGCSARDRFQKRCFLSGDLQRESAPFIGLSDIEDPPLAVAHDAVQGDVICGDERAFQQFKANIEAEFADQRDAISRHQREIIDRIAEGGLRG